MAQPLDRPDGLGSRYPVVREPHVGLELTDRALGERSEDPVGGTAREPQDVERALKCAHVGTVQVGVPQVQQPVAEAERGVDQRGPGLIADGAIL